MANRTIVQVKDGILGNLLGIFFLLLICAFVVWLCAARHRVPIAIVAVFCGANLFVCWIFAENIRKPKSATLAINGDQLVWSVRNVESTTAINTSIPLQSLRTLEFVLPKMKFQVNSKNYPLSELFLIDLHGTRHRLPMELWPGVHRNKIVAALKTELPNIAVTERVDQQEIH